MIWKKIIIMILVGVFFLGIWGQTQNTPAPQKPIEKTKMADVSPELREKAFGLLTEVIKESEKLKLPQNRIDLKIRAADLLWEKEEKQARKVFLEAHDELEKISKEALSANCLADDNNQIYCNTIQSLQMKLIETLIECDVKTAEELLKTADNTSLDAYLLEQKLFEKYLIVNPQKAFEIAEKGIKKQELPRYIGNMSLYMDFDAKISNGVYEKLTGLYQVNQELGAKLAREILETIKIKKITVQSPVSLSNSNLAMSNMDNSKFSNTLKDEKFSSNTNMISATSVIPTNLNANMQSHINNLEFSQASSFLKQAEILNNQSQNQTPLLTKNEMTQLASMLIESLIAKRRFDYHQVAYIYPELVKYAPNQIQKLRRQMLPAEVKKMDGENREVQATKNRIEGTNARRIDDILKDIENAPPEKRDELYAEASKVAVTCCQCSELKDGFKYYLKIEKKEIFPELNEMFADLMPKYKAQNGDVKELRKILTAEKDTMKKVGLLSQAATAIAQKDDIENAKKLLTEAQKLLPEKHKNSSQLRAYFAYTGALASVDSNESFSLLETLTSQANENINTVANFYQFQGETVNIDRGETVNIKNGEFLFDVMEFQSARHIYPSVLMIKLLAQVDFERTLKLADKFSRPEVRLFARWHIAKSLLNKEAEEEEKNLADYSERC